MKLVRLDDLKLAPWKNGGGVTREIALCTDGISLVWRLSVAVVEKEGPFSIFPGLARVLTVIEGKGLRLRCAGGDLDAAPGIPLAFSGDATIACELVAGPVRDFNLIYDPRRVRASVRLLQGGDQAAAVRPLGVFAVHGPCDASGWGRIPPDSFLLFEEHDPPTDLLIGDGGAALMVTLD